MSKNFLSFCISIMLNVILGYVMDVHHIDIGWWSLAMGAGTYFAAFGFLSYITDDGSW